MDKVELRPAADIQAILRVLGRRTQTYGNGEQLRLNFENTDLRGADLRGAQLPGASFWGAQLQGALLLGAQLEGARNLTVEQLSTVKTLYKAHLNPLSLKQIQQQSPHLLEEPRD